MIGAAGANTDNYWVRISLHLFGARLVLQTIMSKRRTSSVTSLELAQALNKLRIKALVIKDIFLSLGTEHYTPLIDVFARSEDRPLTPRERIRIRQMMNAQVYQDDIPLLNLCERAANHYRKQQSNGQAT